jgi:ABC-type glutathione transport system ATPase component
LALSILRLIKPPGHIEAGAVWLDDARIADLDDDGIRRLRLAGIALVPQGSMNSLNPVLRIGRQIADAFADHGLRLGHREEQRRIAALLAAVGLPPTIARMYPHELSGGMKQRACIAIAISLRPKVIIADEPTSARCRRAAPGNGDFGGAAGTGAATSRRPRQGPHGATSTGSCMQAGLSRWRLSPT